MKQFISLAVSFIIIFSIFSFGQEIKEIKSNIVSATVFSNRAMVTREGNVNLPGGKFQLAISGLPVELIDESVRVSGEGTAKVKISDVKKGRSN
jgi:hypothetical protein